jgi:uncharacterized protein (DUF2235 family)
MPKNIVICCDGTGNSFENPDNDSNVIKLYSTLLIDGATQVGYYHPGVGTLGDPTARNWFSRNWSKVKGLAFGGGLLDNVGDAYRYMMNVYEEGDQVYLFGFSRGAYTVRALAGVLRMFGVLNSGNDGLIRYILNLYAKRTRDAKRMTATLKFAAADHFKETFSRPCPLHFVGVWDTVSSYGWIYNPVRLPYTARNPDMMNGRHAISIDERRCFFQKNLWGEAFPHQTLKQVWFAGVHSDVGGSYTESESGLSKIALEWMMAEALSCGLKVDQTKAKAILGDPQGAKWATPNSKGTIHNSLTKPWWIAEFLPHRYYDEATEKAKWRIPLGALREVPDGSVLHETVEQRKSSGVDYSPKNLTGKYGTEPRVAPTFPVSPQKINSAAA